MSILIEDILQAAQMTEEELRTEVAVMLFQKEKLTLAKAAKLAGMSRMRFQQLLASREIPIHYDISEFKEDMAVLEQLKRI